MNAGSAAAARAVARSPMFAEVVEGLSRPVKELSPRFFYDERGSQLFERITQLPEYYLTRAERRLLDEHATALMQALAPRTLVELGAGSAEKTRTLITAMLRTTPRAAYVPIDVSGEFLRETTRRLRAEFPTLAVWPVVADIGAELHLPRLLERPVLFAFLGSTIGNFRAHDAEALLRRVATHMHPGDRLLLGADLRKDVRIIEAAYDDAAGVTAEFNRNMLLVLDRELGADFDPADFAHRAFYNAREHCIEMHLVARRALVATIPGAAPIAFRAGESVRTEVSCKYDRASIARMFALAGLRLDAWLEAQDPGYALVTGARA